MSLPNYQFYSPRVIYNHEENITNTIKRQLSAFELLRNTYFFGFQSFCSLVKQWGQGRYFVLNTLEDEIFFNEFVGNVVQKKITSRANCAISRAVKHLEKGDTYSVAQLFASHARLNREAHRNALIGRIIHEYEKYEEIYHDYDEEKEDLDKAIENGQTLGLVKKRGKSYAQVVLAGAEYEAQTQRVKKNKVEAVFSRRSPKIKQALLF